MSVETIILAILLISRGLFFLQKMRIFPGRIITVLYWVILTLPFHIRSCAMSL